MTDDFDEFIRSALGPTPDVEPSRNLLDIELVTTNFRRHRIRRRALLLSVAAVVLVAGAIALGSLPQRPAFADIPGPGGNAPISQSDPGQAGHWEPARPLFDYNHPDVPALTEGPVLNSFTKMPGYGGEPNFVTASAKSPFSFFDPLTVVPGEQIVLRAYIDNDSIDAKGAAGTAQGVGIRYSFSSGVANGFDVSASVSGENVQMVEDTVALRNNNQSFSLSYVPGSAKEYTFQHINGVSLPDSIIASSGSGVMLRNGGIVRPGWKNAVCVLITLQVNAG